MPRPRWSAASASSAGSRARTSDPLGTSLASSGAATVSVAGAGKDAWTLTLAGTLDGGGLADGAAVSGSNNADVVDGAGNPGLPDLERWRWRGAPVGSSDSPLRVHRIHPHP
jgi:hypothetical protein